MLIEMFNLKKKEKKKWEQQITISALVYFYPF
jgi:hypothetical protein